MASVKAMHQTMLDEFQIKGYWWLPNSEERVSGILFYQQDKIVLELMGNISKDEGLFENAGTNNPIILGFSDKGEDFTLMSAFLLNTTFSSPGFSTETYSIDSFIVGGHFNTVNEMSFHSLVVYPTYFSKWVGKSPYIMHMSEGRLDSISIAETNTFKEYVAPLNAFIEEVSYKVWRQSTDGLNLSFKGGFKIIPEEFQSFDWLSKVMFRLKGLYTLFINYPTYFESIEFYGEVVHESGVSTYRKKYNYFQKQIGMKVKEKFNHDDAMIGYVKVHDNMGIIFNSWFEKQDNLKTILDLYLSDFYITSNLETRFLNAVQTLEIYHRRTFEGKLFDEAFYLEHTSQLVEYINRELPEEMSQRIEGMLVHGNEFSLGKRLRELVNTLEPETKKYLFGNSDDRGRFVQQLVDTRNYLTHYDKEEKKNLIDSPTGIFYSVNRLKAFTTLILFKEIGVNEEVILLKIQESKQYSLSISKAKELLN